MRQFKYTRHVIDRDMEQKALAHYGKLGWELVAVDRTQGPWGSDPPAAWPRFAMFYFKREVEL
jgi:hypothetical protein